MKWNKCKSVCVIFVVFIILTGLSTAIFGAKQIGYNMIIGYKDNLAENATGLDKVRAIIAGCEDGMNTEYVLKNQCINLYGGFQRLLRKKVVNDIEPSNDIIKLENGYLSFYDHYRQSTDKILNKTIEFNDFLKKQKVPLLYVQAPGKISKYNDKIPEGIKDYDNDKVDEYLKGLSREEINFIDLRKSIKKDKIDHYSMFFKTDHHWTPRAGLWAFGKISKELNENYGFNIDSELWNEKNYNIKTYKKSFLASEGKRTGIFYTGLDDFDIITPKFKTNFEFKVESQNIYREGEFKKSLLDFNMFKTSDYFNAWTYSTYSGGDYGFLNIKNKTNNNGKTVLLIRDSFACVVTPFLAEACSELDIVDLRQSDSINLREYVNNNKPDIVIVMYNPSSLVDSPTFNYLSSE